MRKDQAESSALSTSILDQGEFKWGIVSATGIALKDETPETEWRKIIEQVCAIFEYTGKKHAQAAMALGDLLKFGEEKYGETYADAIDATRAYMRVQIKTLMNWQWIAGKIAPARRHENLSLAHHESVAKLDAKEQEEFLGLADNEGLSVKELKEKIRERHPSKARASRETESKSKSKITNMTEAKAALTAVSNYLTANEDKITTTLKPLLEHLYRLYRRKWMSGRSK